jgi:hypothetical protein
LGKEYPLIAVGWVDNGNPSIKNITKDADLLNLNANRVI